MSNRLRWVLSGGVVAIVGLMPLHAFLSIWLGHLFGHQSLFQAWKELVLILMAIAGTILTVRELESRQQLMTPDNLAAGLFAAVALLVTLFIHPTGRAVELGVKTDLGLIAAYLLAQLAASRPLKLRLAKVLLITTAMVSAFALIELILPANFLAHFGYALTNIAPIQSFGGTRRIFSTLGGPNQFGAFLILPLAFIFQLMIKRWRWWQLPLFALTLAALFLTYSRSAWLGTAGALVVIALASTRRRWLTLSLMVLIISALAVTAIKLPSKSLKNVLLHGSTLNQNGSDAKHWRALKDGLVTIGQHPLGRGLGSAGPASFASVSPDIPENYFLQIGIETGVLGLLSFLAFQLLVGVRLWRIHNQVGLALPLLGALIGVSIVNFLLHGWADSSTALVFWSIAGVVVATKGELRV